MPARWILRLLLLLLIAAIVGCTALVHPTSPLSGETASDPRGMLPGRGDSYAWVVNSGTINHDPRFDSEAFEALLRGELETLLNERGLVRESHPGRSDFLVAYWVVMAGTLDCRTLAGRFGLQPDLKGPGLDEEGNYAPGTLGIDVIDPELNRAVWRGVLHDVLEPLADPATRRQRLTAGLANLLARMPQR